MEAKKEELEKLKKTIREEIEKRHLLKENQYLIEGIDIDDKKRNVSFNGW
jgi:hypothetical protein